MKTLSITEKMNKLQEQIRELEGKKELIEKYSNLQNLKSVQVSYNNRFGNYKKLLVNTGALDFNSTKELSLNVTFNNTEFFMIPVSGIKSIQPVIIGDELFN